MGSVLGSMGDWSHAINSKGRPKFSTLIKNQGCNYNIINSIRSTLSISISLEGLEAGKHLLVCRYMKRLHNTKPSLPKYSFAWDVRIVIKYLSRISNNFNKRLSASTLLAVLSGQRAR